MISRFRDTYCRASRKSYRNIGHAGAEKKSQRPPFPMHPARKADAPPTLPTSFVPYKRRIPSVATYRKKPFSDE